MVHRERSTSTQSDTATRSAPLSDQELTRTRSHDRASPPRREWSRDPVDRLPDYASRDDLPLYSEVSQAPKRERFRQVVATRAVNSRLVPSRVAARLSLFANESSTTEGTPRPTAPANDQRRIMNRSDSAPEVFGRNTPTTVRSTVARQRRVQPWTASQYISGARMGPAPAGSRPSTARSAARPSTARSTTAPSVGNGQTTFLSTLRDRASAIRSHSRSASSSLASSRRNSAFGAHAGWQPNSRRPTHGLGISSPSTPQNRSGDVTPSRLSRHAKSLFHRGDSSFRANLSEALARVRRDTSYGAHSPDAVDSSSAAGRSSPTFFSTQDTACSEPIAVTRQTLREPALLRAALRSPSPSPAVMAASSSAFSEGASIVDSFNHLLPREIRIQICKRLIESFVDDHAELLDEGKYRGSVSRSSEHIGFERGLQELIRLARVNKAFLSLVTDGQLWQRLDHAALPAFGTGGVLKMVKATGPFVQSLDLSGFPTLSSSVLVHLSRHLSASAAGFNSLKHLRLSGLRRLSDKAIHHLIRRSPHLVSLDLSNLSCVSRETMELSARCCKSLKELDVSRCSGLDAAGITAWLTGPSTWSTSGFRVLKAAKLRDVDEGTMQAIGKHLPDLETLDLSYSTGLTDQCIAALVEHAGPSEPSPSDGEIRLYVELTARQAGIRVTEWTPDGFYRAVFPNLKHLNLSYTGITDRTCSSLAFGALPSLETLQLAGNQNIKDDGLISLIDSSPRLRKLDLEGLVLVTNDTALALIPGDNLSLPGAELTHLILSQQTVDSPTLLALVKGCPKLYHLELDDTRANDAIAFQCFSLIRQRAAAARSQSVNGIRYKSDAPQAYLSVIDCRRLTRQACNAMLASGRIRPRVGHRSPSFNQFEYGDPDLASPPLTTSLGLSEQTRNMLADECNPERVCVKSFWYWQALDRKEREAKKTRAKKVKVASANGGSTNRMAASALSTLGLTRRGGSSNDSSPSRVAAPSSRTIASHATDSSTTAAESVATTSNGAANTSSAIISAAPSSSQSSRWTRFAHSLFVLSDLEDDEGGVGRRTPILPHVVNDDDDDDVGGRNVCVVM